MSDLKPVSFRRGRDHAPRLSAPYVPGRRNERFWTDAELAIVRRYYPDGGAAACIAHLPAHRSTTSVYQAAKKLGLTRSGQPSVRKRHQYSPEFDERLREEWAKLDPSRKGAVAELATRMGLERWWLTKQFIRLGLATAHRKEPPWTAAEDDLLRRVPLHDPERCSRIFREHGFARSPTAIIVRAKRQSLSRRATRTELSAHAAAAILGIDDKSVTALCIAGELKAGRRGSRRLPQQGGDAWAIRPEDLRQYVVDHIDRIDIRKVDKVAFVHLLTAPSGDAE